MEALVKLEDGLRTWIDREGKEEEVERFINSLLDDGPRGEEKDTDMKMEGAEQVGEGNEGSIEVYKLALTLLQIAAKKWGWSPERKRLLEEFRCGFDAAAGTENENEDGDEANKALGSGDVGGLRNENGKAMIRELALGIVVPGEDDEDGEDGKGEGNGVAEAI